MTNSKLERFKRGLFALKTRRFGNAAELMIQRLYDLEDSATTEYDKYDPVNRKRIEIKFSKASRKHKSSISSGNFIDSCLGAEDFRNTILALEDIGRVPFDSNIEQVKPQYFDVLYYGLFFSDCIAIYHIDSGSVKNLPEYSDKQHRGNKGEGQFHLNNRTINAHHIYLERILSYEALYNMFADR